MLEKEVAKTTLASKTSFDPRHVLGKSGENLAVDFLEKKGFEILFRNYKTRYGELDIICRDGEFIVFIEVRTKKHAIFGHPFDTVNWKKQGKIIRMAQMFLCMENIPGSTPCRFDVIGIISDNKEFPAISHIENAFQA